MIPKIGPFRALAFKPPTPETELLFMKSFNVTVDRYRALVDEVKNNRLQFVNENLDVGKPTRAGGYPYGGQRIRQIIGQAGFEAVQRGRTGAARGHSQLLR